MIWEKQRTKIETEKLRETDNKNINKTSMFLFVMTFIIRPLFLKTKYFSQYVFNDWLIVSSKIQVCIG